MKRLLLISLMVMFGLSGTWAQFDAKVGMGVALPIAGSANAPEVRSSVMGSLEVGRRMGADSPWRLALSLEGLHWTGTASPVRDAVPMDEGLYNKRYLFFPLTLGVSYDFPLPYSMKLRALAAVGGYYRFQDCSRVEHSGVLGDLNDSGFGFALKAAVDLMMLGDRLSLGVSFLALGNPFETEQTSFPARNQAATATVQHNCTLQGFSRCFVGIALGYRFY